MTNSALLNAYIENSGLKKYKIANSLGITREALWRKVNNRQQFKASEISILCSLLKINKACDKELVFFAQKGE